MPFAVNANAPVFSGTNSLKESATPGDFIGSFTRKTPVVGTAWTAHLYTFADNWDISTATFLQSFDVSTNDLSPKGPFFRADGLKMYMTGGNDHVSEYDLSTAWDVSTASFLQSFDVSAQGSGQGGVFFRADGLKMYLARSAGTPEEVNEYDLSTAWDVSTASFLQSLDVDSGGTDPTDVFFRADGLKMYVVHDDFSANPRNVNEWDLSTAWDVSTASLLQSFDVQTQSSDPAGLFFRADGLKMYVMNSATGGFDGVNEYDLSTAWDVSTASFLQSFDVSAQDVGPLGVFFRADGLKMYMTGFDADDVYEYDLAFPVSSTGVVWGHSSETALDDGYGLRVNEYVLELVRFDAGVATVLDSSSVTVPINEFVEFEVLHQADGTFTVKMNGVDTGITATDTTHLTNGRYDNHGIGFHAVSGETGNAVDAWSQLVPVVEDFENGLTAWSGDTGNFTVDGADPVSQPLNSLKMSTSALTQFIVSPDTGDLKNYPRIGETHELRVWLQENAVSDDGKVDVFFGSDISAGDVDNGYGVIVNAGGSLGSGVVEIVRRDPGGDTTLASESPATNIPREVWLTLRIHHASGGTITATLLDQDGAQIHQMTATDSTYITNGEYDRRGVGIRSTRSTADVIDGWTVVKRD